MENGLFKTLGIRIEKPKKKSILRGEKFFLETLARKQAFFIGIMMASRIFQAEEIILKYKNVNI